MRTRTSSNLPGESPLNQSSSNPKHRNRRRSKQPFILEESPVDTMADQCTMAELLRAPTEGYAESNSAGGNLLEKRTQDMLTIIKNKSKQTSAVTTAMTAILKQFQATPPPASLKAIEEICVTCGGAHPYYQCLAADGNTFPELRDNIQGYVVAAAVNYNQDNSGYRPLDVANQIQPPGFTQPNVKNNQNRFSQPQGYNLGNNFNQDQSYQTPTQQNQVVPLSELEKIKRMNEANMKAMQTQIKNVKNELRNEMKNSIQASMSNQTNELKNMMASFFQMNTASTLGSRPLPSNTIANPKGELKAITTRSGIVLDGPSEDEREEETLTEQDLAEGPLYPNIPYPSRMHKEKQQEKDEVQIHKFWQMFKQLHINITLADALILIPKYQKMLKALLSNEEKLFKLTNTPLNENCSAVILKMLPEELGDPGKFLIPCGFSELKCKALSDLGFSINLMSFYVWKKLGLPELISTCMTLELANGQFAHRLEMQEMSLFRTTSSSQNHLLKEFADELALITFPLGNDDLPFDIESDLKEIEYLLNHDPIKDMDSILKDSIDESNLADLNDNLVDTKSEMFTNQHALDYSSPSLYDEYDDDPFEVESDTEYVYDDPFDSKGEKIKEYKLLSDELDLPRSSDFLPSPEYDSFLFEDFFKVDALPSTNNKEKVFNSGILIQENLFEVITHVATDKNVKKTTISHASLILEDFDPPLSDYELPFHKEVPGPETLLSFSSRNEEKVFKPGILTSKGVHSSLLPEVSHQGPKLFKVIKILETPMEIFPCSFGEDIRILDVPCLHFYPP
uniref:Reverse transcriptase domain-containing protein n=1 Tax=Tanacetum cinerariifolium TaxID=118510 RepID=A0A6L2P707_TANCI|nr:reverse transcriptase domain-containing protein [Tanacetum cinerariifolium]